MRAFLCAFGSFSVAIPMDAISSLFLLTDQAVQSRAIEYNAENKSISVSLLQLFGFPPENAQHGIVLKNNYDAEYLGNDSNTIILLSTEVEREIDIPNDEIYSVPSIFNYARFSILFSGIRFAPLQQPMDLGSTTCPIFILNAERLIQWLYKEAAL